MLKDPENGILTEPEVISTSSFIAPSSPIQAPKVVLPSTLIKWNEIIKNLVGLWYCPRFTIRTPWGELPGDFQMAFLWFSANITANNLAVGFLGPLFFELALCSLWWAGWLYDDSLYEYVGWESDNGTNQGWALIGSIIIDNSGSIAQRTHH